MENIGLFDIITVIGTTITAISLVLAYIFYKKSIKIKMPIFAIESRNIVTEKLAVVDGVKVTYYDKQIDNLTVSRIALWNAGKETINKTDIAEKDPIIITAEKGYKILEAHLESYTNDTNKWNVRLSKNNKKIYIRFDYFDYKEGCLVQLLHTGKSSWAIKVTGTVKGVGNLIHAAHSTYPYRKRKAFISSLVFLILCSISIVILFPFNKLNDIIIYPLIASGILYSFLPMILTFYHFYKIRMPKKIRIIDDDNSLREIGFPPNRTRERDKDASSQYE